MGVVFTSSTFGRDDFKASIIIIVLGTLVSVSFAVSADNYIIDEPEIIEPPAEESINNSPFQAQQQSCSGNPIDIVFALDSSGSMSWNDPSGERKTASKNFVDRMNPAKDNASVVSWDDNIDFVQPLTNNFVFVKQRIDAVDSFGGTNLDVGLDASVDELEVRGRQNAVKVVIFLTDGDGTYTPSGQPGSQADRANGLDIVIFTVGLAISPGSFAEQKLMEIASVTGGQYFPSPTSSALDQIFNQISQIVCTCVRQPTHSFPSGAYEQGPWNFTVQEVNGDGLIFSNIKSNNYPFLDKISVPRFVVGYGNGKTKVVEFSESDPHNHGQWVIERDNVKGIDSFFWEFEKNLTDPDLNGTLCIRYEYVLRWNKTNNCEGNHRDCYRFIPKVSFDWFDRGGMQSKLNNFTANYKLDYGTTGLTRTKDSDNRFGFIFKNLGRQAIIRQETNFTTVVNGSIGEYDNIHPAHAIYAEEVTLPGCRNSAFDCAHQHWRWSGVDLFWPELKIGEYLGIGKANPDVLVEPSTDAPFSENNRGKAYLVPNQTIRIAILRDRPSEAEPPNPFSLVNNEFIATVPLKTSIWSLSPFGVSLTPDIYKLNSAQDTVVWYIASARNTSGDTFYRHGFFVLDDEKGTSRAYLEKVREKIESLQVGGGSAFYLRDMPSRMSESYTVNMTEILLLINESLRDEYWIDNDTLVPATGQNVFAVLSSASSMLVDAKTKDPGIAATVDEALSGIYLTNYNTATHILADAIADYDDLILINASGFPGLEPILIASIENINASLDKLLYVLNDTNINNSAQIVNGFAQSWDLAVNGTIEDTDEDGIPDQNDNCQSSFNDQLDSDSDGLGDVCDACPLDSTNVCNTDENIARDIGPEGDTIAVATNNAEITVSGNALDSHRSIFISGNSVTGNFRSQYNASTVSLNYTFGPSKILLNFSKQVSITVRYNESRVSNENNVDIFLFNETTSRFEPKGALCDTINNICTVNVSELSKVIVAEFLYPDIQIKNLYLSRLSNTTTGGKIIVSFMLTNNGTLNTTNIPVLIDKNSSFENNVNFTIPRINAGQRISMFFNWNYTLPGNYTVKVAADRYNTILESNESNNQQILLVMINSTPVPSQVNLSSCGVLSLPTNYTLTQNLASSSDCLRIIRDNVNLDCKNYIINGPNASYGTGIYVNMANSVKITGCNVKNFRNGILLNLSNSASVTLNNVIRNYVGIAALNSNYNSISGNNISGRDPEYDSPFGIEIRFSVDNTITGNRINANGIGIGIYDSSINLVYNNNFSSILYTYAEDNTGTNLWNITKTEGMNIIGGPYLGGNYWQDYYGVDVTNDGIGDSHIPHGPGDFLPLVQPGNLTLKPPISYCQDITEPGIYTLENDIYFCATCYYQWNCISIWSDYVVLDCEGKTIAGDDPSDVLNADAVSIVGKNSAVRNCIITGSGRGIVFRGNYNEALNNTIYNTNEAINLGGSGYDAKGPGWGDVSNNNVTGNSLFNNTIGLQLRNYYYSVFGNSISGNMIEDNNYGSVVEGSTGNLIYNNYFRNAQNAVDDSNNIYNIDKTAGTNIVNGPFLGGNFWHDYTGVDTDGDMLGDTNIPYTSNGYIAAGGDYLPLISINATPPGVITNYSYRTIPSNFIDASSGTNTYLWADDSYVTVQIGFKFTFYENSYDFVNIGTNGFMTFGPDGSVYSNEDIPSPFVPNDYIAPFWDDLNSAAGGNIFYDVIGTAPSRIFIAQWQDVPPYDGGEGATFQAKLYEGSNKIEFQYLDVYTAPYHDNGGSATVGLENIDGTKGTKFSFDTPSLYDGLGILFEPNNVPGSGVQGIVGHWKLDEGSGTIAADSSGNGNTGALVNNPVWVPGYSGTALQFDGFDDYVEVADSDVLDLGFKDFTIAAWVNINQYQSPGYIGTIVGKSLRNYQPGYLFGVVNNGGMYLEIEDGQVAIGITSTAAVPLNEWHHVAVVADRDGNAVFYLDGVQTDIININGYQGDMSNAVPLLIGYNTDVGGLAFDGTIDDVRVYDRVVSAVEIQQLASRPQLLSGWWKFDEGSGTIATDSSGNGNGGTLINNPAWVPGYTGTALQFDGFDDYVSISDSPSFDMASFTLSARIKTADAGTGRRRIISQQPGGPYWLMAIRDNYLELGSSRDGILTINGPALNDDVWHHVAVVRDAGSSAYWYVDGVQVGSQPIFDTGTYNLDAVVEIGRLWWCCGEYFTGTIDDVRVYNRALTAGEIQGISTSLVQEQKKKPASVKAPIQIDDSDLRRPGPDFHIVDDESL